MAVRKITIDQLPDVISGILEEYGEDVEKCISDVTVQVADAGKKNLQAESKAKFRDVKLPRGRYGSGWGVTLENGRLGTVAHIHNKKYPGLPHLLEYGHAKRGGGRVAGRPHIQPVEEKLVQEYQEKVIRGIHDLS